MEDERIGDLLGVGADEVRRRRTGTMKRLAAELGLIGIEDRAELRRELERLPAGAWLGPGGGAPLAPAEARSRPGRRGGALRAAGLVACVAALGAGVWLLAPSGKGEDAAQAVDSATAKPLPAAEVNLDWLAGPEGAGGHVRLVGETGEPRIELLVAGLVPAKQATYQAWLYNSREDAYSLARWRAGEGGLELKLPADWTRYRFFDISLEPPGADVAHDGRSLLRAELRRLRD